MLEKLEALERRYEELNDLMAQPDVARAHERVAEYAKERSGLDEVVGVYRAYQRVSHELEDTRALLEEETDLELREMAEGEIAKLEPEKQELESTLRQLLLPKDPRDDRNVIIEIRAGAGGDEAGLFASDLYRMYTRYAERQGWKTELLSSHETGVGGFKEVVVEVKGRGAFSHFKYESGVHRVQRVPSTESSGRIHTSTATVAVLPEADEVDVRIDAKDLEIVAYGASGPGGQHMQKNATAIRVTHVPTGLVVACESERSQTQNKVRALAILRARLYEEELRKQEAEVAADRRQQVGSGQRSEKIRTYNFPQNRVTDHRAQLTLHRLTDILDGNLAAFVEALTAHEQAERLQDGPEGA
ncbi:MAG: peptide chain release factor 1 [Anaerolineales bacterium]|nr:MAG: peptide chain release factor 1 [Anaerolineales bacterium]